MDGFAAASLEHDILINERALEQVTTELTKTIKNVLELGHQKKELEVKIKNQKTQLTGALTGGESK